MAITYVCSLIHCTVTVMQTIYITVTVGSQPFSRRNRPMCCAVMGTAPRLYAAAAAAAAAAALCRCGRERTGRPVGATLARVVVTPPKYSSIIFIDE
jgi:hypothetical protein